MTAVATISGWSSFAVLDFPGRGGRREREGGSRSGRGERIPITETSFYNVFSAAEPLDLVQVLALLLPLSDGLFKESRNPRPLTLNRLSTKPLGLGGDRVKG